MDKLRGKRPTPEQEARLNAILERRWEEWRAVRPQLAECEYNALGHPSFDASLPRVAVLVTTGRLKGSAPADATDVTGPDASQWQA